MKCIQWQGVVAVVSERVTIDVGKPMTCRTKETMNPSTDKLIHQTLLEDAGICLCCLSHRYSQMEAWTGVKYDKECKEAIHVWIMDPHQVLLEPLMNQLSIHTLSLEPTGTRALVKSLLGWLHPWTTEQLIQFRTCPFYSLLFPPDCVDIDQKLIAVLARARVTVVSSEDRKSVHVSSVTKSNATSSRQTEDVEATQTWSPVMLSQSIDDLPPLQSTHTTTLSTKTESEWKRRRH